MAGIGANLKIEGGAELKNLFAQLPRRTVGSELRKVMNRAATPTVKEARSEAPRRTGALKRAISKKIKTYKDAVVAIIGAKKSVSTGGYYNASTGKRTRKNIPYYYLHLIEGGVRPHEQLTGRGSNGKFKAASFAKRLGFNAIGVGGGMNPGFPARPIIARSFDRTKGAAEAIIKEGFRIAIETVAIRLGKR